MSGPPESKNYSRFNGRGSGEDNKKGALLHGKDPADGVAYEPENRACL